MQSHPSPRAFYIHAPLSGYVPPVVDCVVRAALSDTDIMNAKGSTYDTFMPRPSLSNIIYPRPQKNIQEQQVTLPCAFLNGSLISGSEHSGFYLIGSMTWQSSNAPLLNSTSNIRDTSYQIFVRPHSGKTLALCVHQFITVLDLKGQILK